MPNMRIADTRRFQSYSDNIQKRLVNMNRIQEELSSGRSIFTPSENVRKADSALRAEDALASDTQFLRNIDDGKGWVDSADSSLQAITDLLTEIDSLALAADNSSQNEVDRQNTAQQINQKLETLMGLVNARHGDRYLFGGFATTTSPFATVRDANGQIQNVTLNEETAAGRIYRRIGADEDIQVNVSGTALFQPQGGAGTAQDLFHVVAALRDTVGNNNTPPDGQEDTLSNHVLRDNLAAIRNHITEQQTYLGNVGQRLDQTKARIKETDIQLTDALEQAQGVEITDLVSRMATEEGAYNALAAMGTRLLKMSLVDYLG
jgi:flagellar hook-associated protein 3 FlgL